MQKIIIIVIILILLIFGFIFLRGDKGIEMPIPNVRIVVDTPQPNDVVRSPIEIKGKAIGTWYFEGDFPIKLLDENNNQIGVSVATAMGEWMTENTVPFEGVLEFTNTTSTTGILVIEKDNPSGLPEYSDRITIPVQF